MILSLNSIGTGHAKFDHIYNLSGEEIEESWHKLKNSLEYLVNILHGRAYVSSTDNYELKTDALLVPILVFLANNGFEFKTEEILNKFLYWFYNAMVWSRYTRRGKSAPLEQDVVSISRTDDPESLIENLRREVRDFRVKPQDLKKKPITSPFFNMAFIVSKSKGAIDWFNGMKLYSSPLGKTYRLEKHHIFPQALLKDLGYYSDTERSKSVNEIANRAFLTQKANIKISKASPADYLSEIEESYPDALKAQFIPQNKAMWDLKNFESFLAMRRQLISEQINDFIDKLASAGHDQFNIPNLLRQQEGYNLEFKSSFLWNLRKQAQDKEMKLSVLKTIIAFLNSNGGTLLIGVDDERRVLGLENDYSISWKGTKDSFLLELSDYIQNAISLDNYTKYVSVDFHQIEDREICMVQVEKALQPVFYKKGDTKVLFVRVDNKTLPLDDPEEISDFIKENWK